MLRVGRTVEVNVDALTEVTRVLIGVTVDENHVVYTGPAHTGRPRSTGGRGRRSVKDGCLARARAARRQIRAANRAAFAAPRCRDVAQSDLEQLKGPPLIAGFENNLDDRIAKRLVLRGEIVEALV